MAGCRRRGLPALCLLLWLLLAGCGPPAAPAPTVAPAAGGRLVAVAAENFWGSLLTQVGGDRVKVISIIASPDADPHDYEPTSADARLLASARYVVANGAGYDPWVTKLLDANPTPSRATLVVADLLGKKAGDNPHFWYSPDAVSRVVARMADDLARVDPADAAYFGRQRDSVLAVGLKPYLDLVSAIRSRFHGATVGATESIFVYQAAALGLTIATPPGFMTAVATGTEPSAADKAAADSQISRKEISVLVYNRQNATPDTQALLDKAKAAGIPSVGITETLVPAGATFQAWQIAQLQALQDALGKAAGG